MDAFSQCVKEGRTTAVKWMLSIARESIKLDHVDMNGEPLVYQACIGGHEEIARLLLDEGASPTSIHSNFGTTPLMASCLHGEMGMGLANLLLPRLSIVEINAEDFSGRSALWYAIQSRSGNMIRLLLQWGADCKTRHLEYSYLQECFEVVWEGFREPERGAHLASAWDAGGKIEGCASEIQLVASEVLGTNHDVFRELISFFKK